MKKTISLLLFTCAWALSQAQVNFVKNPGFENYIRCPEFAGTIYFANFWRNAIDSISFGGSDYYNVCADTSMYMYAKIPQNLDAYQYPHSGNAMVGSGMYYDKTPPSPPVGPTDTREYTQGHLVKSLQNGKTYCVSFWVNLAEASGYAHNKIGAYLDDGSINTAVDSAGKEITSVVPQIYTDSIIKDTMNWTKIEGSFIANGTESYITIGLFTTNAATSTYSVPYFAGLKQYSFYLIDDVSVIPIDLKADAGADKWAEQTKSVQIGRVGDSTAVGLDCKWYHKGILIDSGAIISVYANAIKGAIDTYIVVQTVCGNITRDTVVVSTVGLGITSPSLSERAGVRFFTIYPNPSSGVINISSVIPKESVTATVFDILGRTILQSKIQFHNNESTLNIDAPKGIYILELQNENGARWRGRVVVE